MRTCFIAIFFMAIDGFYMVLAQQFEGSATDSGDTIAARFVESSSDPVLTIDAVEYGSCVSGSFPGLNGLNFKGTIYQEMFICPNGFISLTDGNMQNWPYQIGTLNTQKSSAFLAPFWSRVDLTAFNTGDSKVRYQSYHTDTNHNNQVFNKVNNDVRGFIRDTSFSAQWVSVVTWEDIKPFDSGSFGGKNQFQAVIASNETNWYVMYNYADIDWAVKALRKDYDKYEGESGLPVLGWNAGQVGFDYIAGSQYENLPYSGTVNAEDIDDYVGNLGTGRWIFEVGQTTFPADLLCYEWYKTARDLPVTANIDLQCPLTVAIARLDWRFFEEGVLLSRRCFVNIFPTNGPAIRCCYDTFGGFLIKSIPNAGSVLSANPLYHRTNDVDGYKKCCIESNRCEAYFSLLPVQDGKLYKAPHWAWGYGDPHYENMDRMNYTFNGCGEFMFLDGNNGALQIQVRFTQVQGGGLGTVISAVLIKMQNVGKVQINLKASGGVLFLVDGAIYSNVSSFGTVPTIILGSVSVVKPEQNKYVITSSDGSGIEIREELQHLVVTVVLARGLFRKTTGLLGNWSGTTEDDYPLPNGTILQPPLTDEQIHYDFGEKWRLSSGQHDFVNTTADIDFNCPINYRPIFVTNFTFPNASLQAAAESQCGGNRNCLFDTAASLSVEFGKSSLNSSTTIGNDNAVIENSAPAFTVGTVTLNMTVGSLFEYTVEATDVNGDQLTITATGLPSGATTRRTGNTLTFSWLVDSLSPFNLSFVATDVKNSSTELVPFINVCDCKNGAACYKKDPSNQLTALIFHRHYVMDCNCFISYTGQFCETQRDFCRTESGSPCHPLVATCTNTLTGYKCGPCPAGHVGDGQNCSDVDECSTNNGNCQMQCVNSAGSFECQCNAGYRLNADKRSCEDVDECSSGHDCMQICTNTPGSYNCSCQSSFIVDPNKPKDCIPKTACSGSRNCQQVCYVDDTTQQETCSCNRGYKLQSNGRSCADADECTDKTALCTQTCTNILGSYSCSCISGYRLHSDTYSCADINECIERPNSCKTSEGEKCFNLPGDFKCDCNDNQGLVRINGTCQVPTGTQEMNETAFEPPNPAQSQIDNAVQFRLSNFQASQWVKQTDSTFRQSLATALTAYCNTNEQRRTECGLSGTGFTFTELHVNRLPNNPINVGNDALISFYVNYPNGSQVGSSGGPVPRSVLLNAFTEYLTTIENNTGLTATITTEAQQAPSKEGDDLDWPLILGVCLAGILLLTMGCCVLLACSRKPIHLAPREEYYERRRWSMSDQELPYPISGESYQGFDEDGLPVEIPADHGSSIAYLP